MNRTLTAAVALAAALGAAGMANAQTSNSQSSTPMATAPSAAQPGMTTGAPSGTHNPQTMSAPGATATSGASPQADANQMNQRSQASRSDIQQAQQQLKSQGLYKGAVDGVIGPETQTALMAFQREQGLPQTAQLDPQTMSKLGGGSNASGQSSGTQSMTPSYPAGTQNPAAQHPAGGTSGTTGGATSR